MKRLLELMTLYDKILIISVVLISLILLIIPAFNSGNNKVSGEKKYIVIKSSGKQVERIPVSATYKEKPLLVKVEGPIGITIVEAHKGKVRVKEAPVNDPEKICEKTGWISSPGPSIICIPNKLSITIKSKKEGNDLDGVSW